MSKPTLPENVLAWPDETFYIRPKCTSRYWFLVHVADDIEAMRAEIDRTVGAEKSYLAMCCNTNSAHDPWLLGFIFFAHEYMGAGIVAHELAHAALRTLDRRRKSIATDEDEEEFCRIVECLNRSFWDRYHETFPSKEKH